MKCWNSFLCRLQLVTTHALRDNPELSHPVRMVDSIINTVFNFYFRSKKKLDHLRETANRLGQENPQFKYVFFVRWLTSQVEAMERICNSYLVLIQDLETQQEDTSLIVNKLKDRKFILIFHTITDLLDQLQKYTLRFQRSEQVLIDVISFKSEIMGFLDKLESRKLWSTTQEWSRYRTSPAKICCLPTIRSSQQMSDQRSL